MDDRELANRLQSIEDKLDALTSLINEMADQSGQETNNENENEQHIQLTDEQIQQLNQVQIPRLQTQTQAVQDEKPESKFKVRERKRD